MNRRVSIVIPVYNSARTLPKCLDSMIAQTYRDLEIICVNDCSTDSSPDVIREYQKKDPRIKLISHTENRNAGGARNSGIRAATGNYVCFVDNDDWMTPSAVGTLVEASDDFSVDFVAPDWCEWYGDSNMKAHSNFIEGASKTENCDYALMHGFRMLGCLIRRDMFFRNDLFYPERTFWEDNAIALSLLHCSNDIKAVKQTLYYYYVTAGSSSRAINLSKTRDRIRTTQLSYDNLKRLGHITDRNREMVNYQMLCLSCWTIRMLASDGSSESRECLDDVIRFISPLYPNKYVSEMRLSQKFTSACPKCAYDILKLKYEVRRLIR